MIPFQCVDVLRSRVIASMPSNQKLRTRPDLKRPELEIDEMELSSSDDDGEAKTTGFTSSSNLIAMSSVRKASYANKLQHLNGLSTSYPPGDFLKLPLEVSPTRCV